MKNTARKWVIAFAKTYLLVMDRAEKICVNHCPYLVNAFSLMLKRIYQGWTRKKWMRRKVSIPSKCVFTLVKTDWLGREITKYVRAQKMPRPKSAIICRGMVYFRGASPSLLFCAVTPKRQNCDKKWNTRRGRANAKKKGIFMKIWKFANFEHFTAIEQIWKFPKTASF